MPAIDYAARVKRGAEFLDDLRPGWEREINLGTLLLANSCRCILGQLYGHYLTGLRTIGKIRISNGFIIEHDGFRLGFAVPPSEWHDPSLPDVYRKLDELWIAEIRARLRPAPAIGPSIPVGAEVLELQSV